jgi:uncharacterized membrane protein
VLGPVFEAGALVIFAAEHFLAARDLSGIVPRWMPGALFWTYFVGAALLAAAISFIAWRYVRWSASLLALLFLIIVATIDLPNLPKHAHERRFSTLTVRETGLRRGSDGAGGQPMVTREIGRHRAHHVGPVICRVYIRLLCDRALSLPPIRARCSVGKDDTAWVPAPALLAYSVGATLLAAGLGLMIPCTRRTAAASAGIVLLLLTIFFYVPILATEIRSPLAVEGVNYVGDTLLFAATALLAGFGAD